MAKKETPALKFATLAIGAVAGTVGIYLGLSQIGIVLLYFAFCAVIFLGPRIWRRLPKGPRGETRP